MKSAKSLVEIKGFGGKLRLLMDEGASFHEVESELKKLLQRPNSKGFFKGAKITLQGKRKLKTEEFAELQTLLADEANLTLVKEDFPEVSKKKIFSLFSSNPLGWSKNTKSPPVEPEVQRHPPEKKISEEAVAVSAKVTVLPSTKDSKPAENPAEPSVETEAVVETEAEAVEETEAEAVVEAEAVEETEAEAIVEAESPAEMAEESRIETKVESTEESQKVSANQELLKRFNTSEALVIRQTIHSGQNVQSKSTIVVMGDVNAGAEVWSDQDIIVLGSLRGLVHAGFNGNRNAVVFALRMQPIQIRIADLISRASQKDKRDKSTEPEVAFIEDQDIIIETCLKLRV